MNGNAPEDSVPKPAPKPAPAIQNLFDPYESSSSEDEIEELNPFSTKSCFVKPNEFDRIKLVNELDKRLKENQGETILEVGTQGIIFITQSVILVHYNHCNDAFILYN